MATLDDKLLGEKTHVYCSSSEDEEESPQIAPPSSVLPPKMPHPKLKQLQATNTGPKGVIQDWQEYKRLQAEKRSDQEAKKLHLMEKLSLSCKSYLDEQKDRQKAASDEEIDELLEHDPFMQQYLKERMSQMMQKANEHTSVVDRFGRLFELHNGNEYVETIDREDKNVVVICHFYAPDVEGCEAMNGCLRVLADQYKFVKFCALNTSIAGFSHEFTTRGVPALVVYKGGNLIGNFVRLTDEFGDDFYANDVEAFLIDHGILPDENLIPELMKKSTVRVSEQRDSDDD